MTHELSQIHNWRRCHAGIPDGYEVDAVVGAVLDMWANFDCVRDTAELGIAEADDEFIEEIIAEYELTCSPMECCHALIHECLRRVGIVCVERYIAPPSSAQFHLLESAERSALLADPEATDAERAALESNDQLLLIAWDEDGYYLAHRVGV